MIISASSLFIFLIKKSPEKRNALRRLYDFYLQIYLSTDLQISLFAKLNCIYSSECLTEKVKCEFRLHGLRIVAGLEDIVSQ